jgi:hypothetical protein
MKRMIFTLMLAIVSSGWMANEASNWCMPSVRTTAEPWIEVNGTFQAEGFPCEPDEICPPCLTIVLVTSNKTFYLVTDDGQLIEYLDTIQLGTKAIVSGIPFAHGSYDFIQVSHIETDQTSQLPSLCDEWNVLEHLAALGPDYESFSTLHFRLTTDTIINATRYVKLEQDGIYKGAMREGTNADIYYVPNHSTNEYLLYAFNAQVGDSLENLWFGANEIDRFIIKSATVVNIESTTPRKFTIGFQWQSVYSYAALNDTSEIMYAELVWLEGVGFQFGGPLSYECPFECAGGPGLLTLCAYKNGEKVYADPYWNEKVGCEYNRHTLPSLCDEWNVLHETFSWPGGYNTFKYFLSTDTIINGKQYVKLASDKDYPYCGAFREDNNANIYYIPSGSTHEYLIYAFNAQVGDTLSNLWVGGFGEDYQGVVQAISNGSPRIFIIGVKFYENSEYYSPIRWIEGVGSPETPMGLAVVPTVPADIGVYTLLCAYKNGKQIYTSDMGEQYGCEYSTQDEKKKIIGTWQVYKETLSGNDYNEHGEIEYLSRTRDVNDSPTYNFDDSTLLIVCPTCYYTPKHYVLTPKGPTTWNLWVENMFTIQQKPSDPAEGGFSTITIHQLTGNLMEWEYIAYGGDEGPITYYQYLRRVGTQDSDTIPLYAQDDSGSSTVDPVDPNQVIATLKGDELTIRDNSGEEIMMALSLSEGEASVPAFNRVQRTQSFRNELTVTLTEEGLYRLELSNPSWEYTIYGTFRYPQQHDAIDQTLVVPAAQKILRNGQLLIRIGDKVYTVHGTEVGE